MKLKLICMLLLSLYSSIYSNIYLWQMEDERGSSCCLHMQDVDICNPYKPCSKVLAIDMNGILDYVLRILGSDKNVTNNQAAELLKIKKYIRSVLSNPYMTLAYRLDMNRVVSFYHDNLTKVASTKPGDKPKPKVDYSYFAKLGLIKDNKSKFL